MESSNELLSNPRKKEKIKSIDLLDDSEAEEPPLKRTPYKSIFMISIRPMHLVHMRQPTEMSNEEATPYNNQKRLNFKIPSEKLQAELETLADLLKQQKFFQEKNIQKQSDLVEIAQVLQLENFHSGSLIFDYGDVGDKFYIILQGQVGIEIPEQIEVLPIDQERNIAIHQELMQAIQWASRGIRKLKNRLEKIKNIMIRY